MKKLILIAAILSLTACVPDDNEATKDNGITNAKSAGEYICSGSRLDGSKVMFTIYQGRHMMYLINPVGNISYQQVSNAVTARDRALYCQMNGYINTDC